MRLFIFISTLLLVAELATATTISPFQDLGQLTQTADAIYVVTAIDIRTENYGDVTNYYQEFNILETIKGEARQTIPVKYHSLSQTGKYLSIAGEIKFEKGVTYLLFLRQNGFGEWMTACVSYYIFEQINVDDQDLLIPIYQKGLLHVTHAELKKEPLWNYDKNRLIRELKAVAKHEKKWNASNALAPSIYQRSQSKVHKVIPSHCNLIATDVPPRWKNMATDPVKVYYQSSGSACSNMANRMNTVMSYMSSNYRGLNFNLAGTFNNFSPNCLGGEAQNGNFQSYVDNNLNGPRSIVVMFNDPCNQIPNLNNCGGILARAGLYRYTSLQHQYNGETYSEAAYGYVIVNNGTGTCSCSVTLDGNSQNNYTLILTHELTHAIGFGHMSTTQGNMSMSNCCSSAEINALDKQCVNYVYNPPNTPVCNDPAAENYNSSSNCTYCSNSIKDGDETGIDCGGTGPGCPACRGDLTVMDCGTLITSPTSVSVTGIQVTNNGQGVIGNSHVGYYLSLNNTITKNDYFLGEDYVPSLGIGLSSSESFSFTKHNSSIPNGLYYFGMIADYKSTRPESSETNNSCLFSSPRIRVTSCNDGIQNGDETNTDCGGSLCASCSSDLIIESCGTLDITSSSINLGEVRIKNNGLGPSPATYVGYYLSSNRTITTDDYLIGTDFVTSLNPGQVSTESFSRPISNLTIPFGRFYIGMIADYQELEKESSEVNNSCIIDNPKLTISSCGDGIQNGDETEVDCGGSLCRLCDCDTNKVYRSNISTDINRHARDWITTSGTVIIRSAADVNLIAKNYILLNPGFEVTTGSTTVLNTQNCIN